MNLLVLNVERRTSLGRFQELVGEGQKVLLLSVVNDQQRGFAGSKLYGCYASHTAPAVNYFTTYEIANICHAWFELCSLRARDLQLAPQERFRVVDGVDALQLQNQTALVRPKSLQFDFASLIVLPEREQAHAWGEAVGMTGV